MVQRAMIEAAAAIAAMAAMAAGAAAEPPTAAEVQTTISRLRAASERDGRDPAVFRAGLGAPLWLDRLTFDEPRQCRRRSGTLATPAAVDAYVDCLIASDWSYSIDGDGDFVPVDPARPPRVFRKHKRKLRALAKDHALFMTHFCPAGPGDFWTLYVASRGADGAVHVDGLAVHNDDQGACREE